jgi:UDP:flavonoid glycosyltransferase YjiC (YdhE family)
VSTFLFTTLPSNDLGLLARSLPIAHELRALGHAVVFCSPGAAPRRLIAEAGFANRLPDEPLYDLSSPASLPRLLRSRQGRHGLRLGWRLLRQLSQPGAAEIWNIDQFLATFGLADAGFTRAIVAALVGLMRECRADAVVDFWNPFACIAARVTRRPLVSVIQADMHPDSAGFIWWRPAPAGLPTALPAVNRVLAELGLPRVARTGEVLLGDLTFVAGTPETDPLPAGAAVTYVGPLLWQKPGSVLPDWVAELDPARPVVWLYAGNLRYMPGLSTPFDSLVIVEACIEALRDEPVQVVLSTGYQSLPRRIRRLPANFRQAVYLPGLAMAERSTLLIHHGGYGSCQTGLAAGRPAVIVPTYSERESNARRVAAAGAGIVVLPEMAADGRRKTVRAEALREAVRRILADPSYAENAGRAGAALRQYGGPREAARLIAQQAAAAEPAAVPA